MKNFVCFTFLLCISLTGFAQKKVTDSLLSLLKNAPEDSNRVKILDDLSWEFSVTDQAKSRSYAEQQLDLAKKIGYTRGIANAYSNIGSVLYLQGNFPEAINFFSRAVPLRKQTKDLARAAGSFNNIAMCYQQMTRYPSAVNYYVQALGIFETLKDVPRAAQTKNNISSLYAEMKQFDPAFKYALESLEDWKKVNNNTGVCGSYVTLGNCHQLKKNFREAISNYEKALDLAKKMENKRVSGRIYHNLGAVYTELKDYEKALYYIKKEIPLKEEAGDKEGIASACHSLGRILTIGKKYDEAIAAFSKCALVSLEIKNRDNLRFAYLGLKEAYEGKKQYAEAMKYFALYDVVKDSILNETFSKQVAEMQTKYDTEKKEKQNMELKRETEIQRLELKNEEQKRKTQLIIGLSFIGLAGASALFLYNRKKLKDEARRTQELAEEEKKRFKAMIEAEEKERSRIAQELHDGLGQMLSTARLNVAGLEDSVLEEDREWLEKSLKIIDSACQEVRNISHNMMPSALIRLGLAPALQDLVNDINAAKALKVEFTHSLQKTYGASADITIYRIIQEALNNMIRHSKASLIVFDLQEKNGELYITLSDNGVGFDAGRINESKGIGWKNIFSRVSMMEGKIKVSSAPGKGTEMEIQLKTKP